VEETKYQTRNFGGEYLPLMQISSFTYVYVSPPVSCPVVKKEDTVAVFRIDIGHKDTKVNSIIIVQYKWFYSIRHHDNKAVRDKLQVS
jgi:hypothetical protein